MTPAPSFLERFPPWVEEYLASSRGQGPKDSQGAAAADRSRPAAPAVGRRLPVRGPDHKKYWLSTSVWWLASTGPTKKGRQGGFSFHPGRRLSSAPALGHLRRPAVEPCPGARSVAAALAGGGLAGAPAGWPVLPGDPQSVRLDGAALSVAFPVLAAEVAGRPLCPLGRTGPVLSGPPSQLPEVESPGPRVQVQNQTPVILADPEFFFGDDPGLKRPAGWLRWLPRWSFAWLMPWLPVYILTLRKDENSVETLDGERF